MKTAVLIVLNVTTIVGCAVGLVFAKPPLEFYYAQWVEHWSMAERLCQCAGC